MTKSFIFVAEGTYSHLPLLAVGGVVYSLGVIFYVCKRIPYNHAIWHGFVLGGSVCHFLAIYLYIGQA
ncbi:hemolysin III family protein [Escherichia coli]|uniref:hemolysin III family protein n=1 Tax=Escherichia coli TaxID=562 RepID=UPI003C30D417